MSEIIKPETAINLFGVEARAFNVIANTETGRIRNQAIGATRYYTEMRNKYRITVNLRFDDECNNGHETFAITADIRENDREYMSGCCHDEIAQHFPELAHLIKWHLVSTDEPMYYAANTMYHALEHGPNRAYVYFTFPADPLGIAEPEDRLLGWCEESKARAAEGQPGYRVEWDAKTEKIANLDHARSTAIWPEATAEQLRDRAALLARLPALMAAFKADMLACGFLWPEVKGE